MIGVAVTGERAWHASWWEWHGLIVLAFLVVGLRRAARVARRALPPPLPRRPRASAARRSACCSATWRASPTFSERVAPSEVAEMLKAYYELAAPLVARRRRRDREVHRRRHARDVQHARRPARPRAARGAAPRSRCSAAMAALAAEHPGLAAPARRRQQRRGRRARARRRTGTSRTRWSATPSTSARGWRPTRRWAAC